MKRIAVAIAATTLATMGSAQAAPTIFTFSTADNGNDTIVKALDGITLTMGNFTPGPYSFADSDGLAIYGPDISPTQKLTSLTMTFDQPVKLLSYVIGYLQQLPQGVSTTYSQGALQSIQTYDMGGGLYSFNNQFIAAANVPISVASASGVSNTIVEIKSLTVEKVDPVPSAPGPLPLAGAAAAFSLSRRLRGRIRRTARV
jgi:hypothetical protein